MKIHKLLTVNDEVKSLWVKHMDEPWEDYKEATHFIQTDEKGKITAGFAVYWDEDNDINGHYISGWSDRKNYHSVVDVIQHVADTLGEVFIKTDKRNVKILALMLGDLVGTNGSFSYYIIRGKDNGKTTRS